MEEELTLTSDERDSSSSATQDEYAEIREHYEKGIALTDAELDKVADTAITYVREMLALFGEKKVTIDEYEGDEGELILDVSGGDLAVLIGRHGRTLDAFQLIISSFAPR